MIVEHLEGSGGQVLLEAPHRSGTVLEVAGHRPLSGVEVERAHAVAGRGKRDRRMHRGRRLAGAALFVGEDDEMRLAHA